MNEFHSFGLSFLKKWANNTVPVYSIYLSIELLRGSNMKILYIVPFIILLSLLFYY